MFAQIPEIDTLTKIRPEKIPGGFIWGINFKLPVPAEQDGYIIQKIRQVEEATLNGSGIYKDVVYWEAWEVKKGESTPKQSQSIVDFVNGRGGTAPNESKFQVPRNDIFYKQYVVGGKGLYLVQGLAGFYHVSLPSDFISGNPNTGAGQLLSTINKPSFWCNTCLYRQVKLRYDFTTTINDDSKNHVNHLTEVWDFRPLAKAFGL